MYGSGCLHIRILAANKPNNSLSHDFKLIVVFLMTSTEIISGISIVTGWLYPKLKIICFPCTAARYSQHLLTQGLNWNCSETPIIILLINVRYNP